MDREKSATDRRIASERNEKEMEKLKARIQELDAALESANYRADRASETRHQDGVLGTGVRIAALEAELFNAEKQTQLARGRERAMQETNHMLEERMRSLEAQVVDQAQRIHQLATTETDLRNQLQGSVTREVAEQQDGELASLREEVSRLGTELAKHKELSSIAAAQALTITSNAESSANEVSLLRTTIRDLQAKGDQPHLLAELHQRIAVLQLAEANAQHRAEHYRTEYQRLSLTHHKLVQKTDTLATKYFTHKAHHLSTIQAYHQRMDHDGDAVCVFQEI